MSSRKSRRTHQQKQSKATAPANITVLKRATNFASRSLSTIRKKQWEACKKLEQQISHAWNRLKSACRTRATVRTINKDRRHLMSLLGQCKERIRSRGR